MCNELLGLVICRLIARQFQRLIEPFFSGESEHYTWVLTGESAQRELSNEYQCDRVSMVFKNLCALVVFWMQVASALEGLSLAKCQCVPVE